jgi:hypothetical protein
MTFRGTPFVDHRQYLRTTSSSAVLIAVGLLAVASPVHAQRGPAAASTNLSPEVLSLACSPSAALEAPPMPLRITGGQDSFARRIYSPGDLVTINAGRNNAIEVGQEYFVRRLQVEHRAPISRETPATIRTTGWIKVYAVDDEMSLVTVTHACDTIEVGDYLEPFKLPVMPTVSKDRPKPERDNYGKVLVGADRRKSFGKGDYLVINRGADFGIEVGSQFVLYRDKKQAENFLFAIGEGIATEVKDNMATVLVTVSLDAIESGDYAALRRDPQQK